ncbi:nucleoside 2-deoxyribosyltransferase [Lacticaseibacillus paracasei]|uniref:nucleoside 2-deoxyribosyltransferase n=1 Tax=Lacticaseibacillus paracasei TaxID=1597 RepID=UPI001891864A|nr:nucleoside 2-deoxyribosyltransferase [Lacticaseibacillus paracasei]QPB56477.1 hypothetical protein GFB64_04910 [Lacticaseibacillus paracasei]WPQ31534.1 nucleoside 2-deoxyribosyltransferase [Lacticaseibacillus paracasei]
MKKIFFVTPIGNKNTDVRRTADFVMNTFLRPVAESLDFDVLRADPLQEVSDISNTILEQLASADLVIADTTGANPNVMFELGYRMALNKPYLILTQNVDEIPFDIRGIRALQYEVTAPDVEDFKERLNQMIRIVEDAPSLSAGSAEALGERMGADMLANAIQSGDFSTLENFVRLAKKFGSTIDEDDK